MAEQLAHCDRHFGTRRISNPLRRGQVPIDILIEVDATMLDLLHDERCGEEFRDRPSTKDRLRCHWTLRFEIRVPEAARVDDLITGEDGQL